MYIDSISTEAALAEFLELQKEIKYMTLRLEEIKEQLKERGSFATKNFVVAVLDQSRTSIASLDTVAKAIDINTLETLGLIKTSVFKVVKVSRK